MKADIELEEEFYQPGKRGCPSCTVAPAERRSPEPTARESGPCIDPSGARLPQFAPPDAFIMKVLIPNYRSPDSFVDNVTVTAMAARSAEGVLGR